MTVKRHFSFGFFENFSLKKKLNLFSFAILVPVALMIGILIFMLNRYGSEYNNIILNITTANEYNITFKEQIDETMYRIVIGSLDIDEINKNEPDPYSNIHDPYTLIAETRQVFEGLSKMTTATENQRRIRNILKELDTLTKRIDEIYVSVQGPSEPGKYDENMFKLETNIYILTEIIQDDIQKYIYYEATNLDAIRENVNRDLTNTITVTAVTYIAVMLGMFVFSWIISKSISRPLQELCTMTRLVGEGDLSRRVSQSHGDEVKTLSDSFNIMLSRIETLVDDVKKEQLNLRVTELKLLQAQINPHFLYNTLDTIVWLAETDEKAKVVEMVTALSDFFRATLSKGQDFITIKEEETHVRSYLQIQKMRYHDILEYEIDIPDELHQFTIVKLTLQPIVENALYHGIKTKRGRGRIRVYGYAEEHVIRLFVQDDGVGMDAQRLSRLRRHISSEKTGDTIEPIDPSDKTDGRDAGFGLANVQARLQLNYGSEYGLLISSAPGAGTTVEIRIPRILRTDEKIELES